MAVILRSGARLPAIGFGCWKLPNKDAAAMVYDAIKAGFRHLDCACDYGNEKEVGQGIARAISEGIVSREELWITSKLWNTYHRAEHVRPALERSLADLGIAYVDLYLIHFPIALRYVAFDALYPPEWVHPESLRMELDRVPLAETWAAMEALQDAGLARALGVCNMTTGLLTDLASVARQLPEVLQVEMHPRLTQERLLRYCREAGIAVTAFSPLGAGSYVSIGMAKEADSLLVHDVVKRVAGEVGATPAQVILAWGMARGVAVIPKCSSAARAAENFASTAVRLSPEHVAAISALNTHTRYNDPGVFCAEAFGTYCPIFD